MPSTPRASGLGRRRTLLTVMACLVLSALGGATSASARYIPCEGGTRRFDGSTIRWKMLGSAGTKYEVAASRATAAWDRATDVKFVRDEKRAKVFFGVGQTTREDGVAAEAELLPPNQCKITSADITFDTRTTDGYDVDTVQAVAAHELGHVLGLDHEFAPPGSKCYTDSIMMPALEHFYNDSCQWTGPRSFDISEVDRVYK